ncbi:MAG: Crp/Fnr family transcriptional regulator [Chitinophagaceae bacterium]|nr:Crp/Fnr family transcriptional regulator [Chitinophagaceae bacterium]
MELLLHTFSKHISITEQELTVVLNRMRKKTVKKKQYLLQADQVAKDAAFVVSGCLRSYSIDDNGFEHILQFAPQGWWITDMFSFISEQPGNLFIDAIENTELLLLSRKDQLALFDELPKLERYFRIVTEKSLVNSRQRLVENLSLTAKERYERFCNIYPTLINTLPQKQIAGFIGVTPEFLSKMKSQWLRG